MKKNAGEQILLTLMGAMGYSERESKGLVKKWAGENNELLQRVRSQDSGMAARTNQARPHTPRRRG